MSASASARSLTRRTAITGAFGVALATTHTLAAQDDPTADLQYADDVVYGEGDAGPLLVNIVRPPDRAEPRPAVVIVHGGGLIQGSRWDHAEAAIALAAAGYVTFNIEYTLYVQDNPATLWPIQLVDTQRAVRWIRANADTWNVDPERIGAFGFSSGGQLAAFLGTRDTVDDSDPELAGLSSRVSSVVTMGGLFDFTFPDAHLDGNQIDAEILGGSLENPPDAAAYADFSPIAFVDATSAAFAILQEGSPDIIPYEHPMNMMAALMEAGAQVSYSWFPGTDHGTWFSWLPEAPETLAHFARHLRPEV